MVFKHNGALLRLNKPQQNRKDGKPRDYHLWLHGLGKYPQLATNDHIKSGDAMFMFTTAKLMEERAKDLAAKELKKKR